ncbi:hypothetical protein CHS0354_008792 [Potamilus streckersoni]|uniref:Uncharacterized protein n=1 Tax=Potamilus streckersoni TaxID=2493646 RepID=A0AAE0VZX3_9BIVA|nr:hypothetical protein CHS0354_008792 [Potamilus streckersoni]
MAVEDNKLPPRASKVGSFMPSAIEENSNLQLHAQNSCCGITIGHITPCIQGLQGKYYQPQKNHSVFKA